jgi:radical SAM superfamily enzyme YgiQ (UPF0313 family)
MNKCLLFNVSSNENFPRPVGIYRLATTLRNNDWDAEVIDFVPCWTLDELKQLARQRIDQNTKFFGFGYLFSNYVPLIEDFCQWLRVEYPDLILIYGSMQKILFKTTVFHYYISGYAENSILVLLKYLFNNGARPVFDISQGDGRKVIDSINSYPAYPMKDLFNHYESRDFVQPWEWLTTEMARGCKFQCSFCNFPLIGVKGDFDRAQENIQAELQSNYDRFGVQNYFISDETFNDRTEKIIQVADVVDRLSFKPWFSAFIRPDLLASRPGDREHMLRMGLYGQYYGVESFNNPSARAVGKGYNTEKIKQAILETREYFNSQGPKHYRGSISLIAGLPFETMETLEQARQWIKQNWAGEHIYLNPLMIKMDDNKRSKIAQDYEKYGYREILPQEVGAEVYDKFVRESPPAWYANGEMASVVWKNNDMDIFMARDFTNNLLTEIQPTNRKNPWNIGYYHKTHSMAQRLSLLSYPFSGHADPAAVREHYVTKKLDL